MNKIPERPSPFDVLALSTLCLLLLSGYAAAEMVTFRYAGTDGAGATVSGTFGYDTDAPEINNNAFAGVYLTGFINGVITGGAADGFSFNLNMSGAQTDGNLRTVVSANEFFSTLWINEIAGVGEIRRLDLDSTSTPVFDDISLPTDLNVADWLRKNLDIRSLAPNANLFELTEINKIPATVGPTARKVPVAINTILLGEDEAISYSFSTATASGIGEPALVPLFAGLSVSGTFNYANSVPAVGVVTGPAVPGAAIYAGAPTNIAGSVNGLNFSDSSGFVVVGNDRFVSTGLTDFLSVAARQLDTAAFEINGFTLVHVRLFWIESDTTMEDFLVSDLLPTALPEIEGRLALDFTPTADPGVETSVFFDGLFVSPMP